MSSAGKLLVSGMLSGIGGLAGSLVGQSKIGAQLGWLGGAMLGGKIFGDDTQPTGMKRLNLEKIATQTSTYGAEIQEIYGSGRIAGNIIWAEEKKPVINDEGEEYTITFALHFLDNKIGGIRKLWADNKLLFDQSELTSLVSKFYESKYADKINFYNGSQTAQDPIMAESLGTENVPIYKDQTYIVFKNFKLGDYDNRIPNIQIEVASSAEIIDNLHFAPDGLLYPTSIEVLNGDLYVSYSEKYYKTSGVYTTPKIKKMKGISTVVDWVIDITEAETIKSFKFFNNGLKFITAPIDFVIDTDSSGTENDITEYKGAIYTYSGQFVTTIFYTGRNTNETIWYENASYEKKTNERNGFIVEDIDVIKDELYKDTGWLEAILKNRYTDPNDYNIDKYKGKELIIAIGTKWWFDINNEWNPVSPTWKLIGKEKVYSAPYIKIFDSSGNFVGDQSITQTLDAMNGYPELIGTTRTVKEYIHEGYVNTHIDYDKLASGWRSPIHYYPEKLDTGIIENLNSYYVNGYNNCAVAIQSTMYTTRTMRDNLERESLHIWLMTVKNDKAEEQQILSYFGKDGRFDMINTPKRQHWDITDIFSASEKTINITKYLFDDKMFILLFSDNGNVKVIKEGSYETKWVDNEIGGGQTLVYIGEDYEEINFERFVANNIKIKDIIEDLYSRVGVTEFDNTAIDDIEIGGYLRDKTVPAKSMIQPFLTAFYFDIIDVDWQLKAVLKDDSIDAVLDENYISVGENNYNDDFVEGLFDRKELPNICKVTYTDILRDYQENTQTATWVSIQDRNEINLKLPFIVSAIQAKQIAEKTLQIYWNTRSSISFSATIKYLYLMPNDVVNIKGKVIRITTVDYDIPNLLRFSGVEIGFGMYKNNTLVIDNPITPTDPAITLSDVSFIVVNTHSINKENNAGYYVAMWSNKTWRGAKVYIGATGQNMNVVAKSENESDIGILVNALDTAIETTTIDYGTVITVKMQKNSKYLRTVEELEMLNYKNIIAVGVDDIFELISYTKATYKGNLTWELTGIIRGVRGTDIYNMSHAKGAWVIPVDGVTFVPLDSSFYNKYVYMKILPALYGTSNSFAEKNFVLGRILEVWNLGDVFAYRNKKTKSWNIRWNYRTRINGEWRDYTDITNIDGIPTFEIIFGLPLNKKTVKYDINDTEFEYTLVEQQLDWPGLDLEDVFFKIRFYNNWDSKTSKSYIFSSL